MTARSTLPFWVLMLPVQMVLVAMNADDGNVATATLCAVNAAICGYWIGRLW